MKKKSINEHKYNISVGFFVAILVAGIIKFLEISKLSFFKEKIPFIDWIIVIFLGIIALLENISIKNLFVEKKKIVIPKKQRIIDYLTKILVIILIFIFLICTKLI